MTITKQTLAIWEPLRERGDIKKLMVLTGLGRTAVYDVFKTGECSISAAAQFLKFYQDKQALVKSINQDQD